MQDTKNLLKKVKEYRNKMRQALLNKDGYSFIYYEKQLDFINKRIAQRKLNGAKNDKEYKKAHGHNKCQK